MDTFFFFVPNRLIWDNWKKFMGEQANPGDSIDYLVPTVGQVSAGKRVTHSALPLRAYNLIYNNGIVTGKQIGRAHV